MNNIETKPIGQLILNKETPYRKERVEHYLIPDYQRGYRWNDHHVEALLDDIDNFIVSGEDNYCLQPIVVIPKNDENGFNIWEVIDGQQRLITLHIIFKCIHKSHFQINFEKRGRSTDFLKELDENTLNDDNPDFHFMSNAYRIISLWFKSKTENDISYIDEFYTTVTKRVQVIWYQLFDLNIGEKIDIFKRLNIGKIPLTDSELIRALLLSKIKYNLTPRELNMRQSEISSEWDSMEHELQKEELWYFLNNEKNEKISSRIEYIFNLIAGEKNPKNYSTYLWFEKTIKKDIEIEEANEAEKLWHDTKEIFAKFKSWYNNRTLYHYVGFLLSIGYPVNTILKNSNSTKTKFKGWLFEEIKASIMDIELNNLKYGDNAKIEKTLLLFNVITMENLTNVPQNRFPFNHYKYIKHYDGGWSIEHIHAQQSQDEMKQDKAIRVWLKETLNAIENIAFVEKEKTQPDQDDVTDVKFEIKHVNSIYIERINELLVPESMKVNVEEFNRLKDELIGIFESKSVHELDNLALISKKDNSSLSNSIFPVKRNKIIELERAGKFIPPCTRNVFLKLYSNADNQPYYWSSSDKTSYFEEIKNVLNNIIKN